MFNKKFLRALLQLQKDIEALQVEDSEGNLGKTLSLTDVCFKPLQLAPGDTHGSDTANGNCSINSIWAYWQDEDKLDDVHDHDLTYLDHFTSCANNPSQTKQGDTE